MKHTDFDDVGDAIREDRPLREAAAYRIRSVSYTHLTLPTTPYV